MTSRPNMQKISPANLTPPSKEGNITIAEVTTKSIKGLVGRKMTKAVKFCDGEVNITKLSVAQVQEIQNSATEHENDDEGGLKVLRAIVGLAVEGGSELTDEDFASFPMDELSKLSNEIMKFSGIASDDSGK